MAQKKTQPAKSKHELWKETVEDGVSNASWDVYDATIKLEVADYNTRLSGTPGFKKVDWLLIKAMLWTESGGPQNKTWKTRVMQIGNSGDPGYDIVKNGKEGASVVASARVLSDVVKGNIDEPHLNVRVAIAYLFTRMAKFENKSVVDSSDPKVYSYTVVKGDKGLSAIASKVGSTTEILQKLNPGKKLLREGDVIQYQKGSIKMVVSGWRTFDTATIAARYNGGGDDRYAEKLNYVLGLFARLKRS